MSGEIFKKINNHLKSITMNSKEFYVTPVITEVELEQEGVLCSSERNGTGIDPLNPGQDWSDMWN